MTITLVAWTSVLTDVVVVVNVRASPAGVIGGDVNSNSLMDNAVWEYSSFLSIDPILIRRYQHMRVMQY